MGDFRPEKNLEFLIKAWSRVQKRLVDPLPLVLAGAQTGQFRKIRKAAEAAGMGERVLFPGFIRAGRSRAGLFGRDAVRVPLAV